MRLLSCTWWSRTFKSFENSTKPISCLAEQDGSGATDTLLITHTFSAFWLRSSVVSVLISLISDRPATAGQKLNQFLVGDEGSSRKRAPSRGCPAIALPAGAAHPVSFLFNSFAFFLTLNANSTSTSFSHNTKWKGIPGKQDQTGGAFLCSPGKAWNETLSFCVSWMTEKKVGRRASASSHRYQKFSCVLTP